MHRGGHRHRRRYRRGRVLGSDKPPNPLDKGGRSLPAGQARPLHRAKKVGNYRLLIAGAVDHNRHEEGLLLGQVMGALDGELPFASKIALEPFLRVLRDDRNEQRAFTDLAADLLVPQVSAAQLALIEPDLDTGGAQPALVSRQESPSALVRVEGGWGEGYQIGRAHV